MTRQRLRDEMRKLMLQYLNSNTISPGMYVRTVARLVDTASEEDQRDAEELGQKVVVFFEAIYNYYQGFIEIGGGWITADTAQESYRLRERELRTMRYVKGLFRKGLEYGSEFPC